MQSIQRGTRIVRIQKNTSTTFEPGAVNFTGAGFSYAAGDVANVVGLYEQYMLAAIRVTIRPAINSFITGGSTGTNGFAGMMYARFDPNDSANPTTVNDFLENNNYTSWSPYRSKSFYFKPNYILESAASSTGATVALSTPKRGWLNSTLLDGSNGMNIPHFGFKIGYLQPFATDNSQTKFIIDTRYYIKLKTAS